MESDLGTCLKEYLAESAHPIRQDRAIIFNRNFGIYIVPCRFASADPRRFLLAQGNSCYSRHCLHSSPITIILAHPTEAYFAVLVLRADRLIAPEGEAVIQRAGGHADLRSWSLLTQLQMESACPPSFNAPPASVR